MTMDVSRLGIVVESTGIQQASTALQGRNGQGGLAGAAAKAEKNVTALTASMSRLMNVQASATTQAWATAMGQLGTAVQQVGQQLAGIVNQLNAVTAGMNQVSGATNRAARANDDYHRGSHVVMNTLKALATVSTVYAGINMAGSIIKQADSWQMMQARLTNATGSLNNAKVAQQDMYELSMKLRVPLEDQVRLYTRMAPSMQRMGKSAEDTKNVVEGVATALQLSGANGAEMSSVMTQLSQAFGSGNLNGAEFTAVAENGVVIMRALEYYTGKTTAQLKKMGSEGKLSVATLNAAIEEALPKWREQFDKLPVTFEGAVQRIKNAWTRAIGEMGTDTAFNRELSQSLRVIEDMIPAVAKGLGEAFIEVMKWVKENKVVLGQIWDQVKGLAVDVWNVGKGIMAWVGAMIGAGDEVSVVGAVIFGIRTGIAAVVDLTKILAATLVKVGADIGLLLTLPVQLLLRGVMHVTQAFADLISLASRGAQALGMTAVAEKLNTVNVTVNSFKNSFGDASEKMTDFFMAGHKMADSWVEGIFRGEGAVSKLWNSTKELTKEAEKTKGVMDDTWGKGKGQGAQVDDKAAKAAAAERKRFDEAMLQAQSLLIEQQRLNASLNDYGLAYEKIGPAQKKVIELEEEQTRLVKDKASEAAIAHNATLIAIYKEAAAYEVRNERMKEGLQEDAKSLPQAQDRLKAIEEAAAKAEDKLAHFGEAKGATDQEVLERLKNELAGAQFESTFSALATPADIAHGNAMVEVLTRMVEAQQRLTDANRGIGANETMAEFEKLMDPKKAEKFGDALATGFGKAGKAIGGLVNSMQAYEARMSKVAKAWELVNKQSDPEKREKMSLQAAEAERQAWVSTYADMAGAAKGFFEEGTVGYKALEAAEKAFRAFEIAMSIKSFAEKSGLLTAFTSMFVASKATETAAEVATVAPHVAAEGTKASASGVAALAKTLASLPFPANIAAFAAVAALLVGIGVAVSGGGGSGASLSEDRQAKQGTGTVFGDADAKSESIANSLEYLSENSDIALRHSSGMLSSLRNIEASLTGVTNALVRGDISGRGYDGSSSGASWLQGEMFTLGLSNLPIVGDFFNKISGFGSSSKLLDAGLTFDPQSMQDILAGGLQGKSYQDVETTKKAFFIEYDKDRNRDTEDLSQDVEDEFSRVIGSMVDTITEAGTALGFSAEEVRARLEAMSVDLGDISLEGLTAEEIQAELEAVFSALGDTLVEAGLGQAVTAFQQAGKGLLETAVRVATGVEQAEYELEKLGLTAVDFSDIINKNGDVGAEIVRQSILMEEAGTGVGEIISTLGGTAADIAATYKDLVNVRTSLSALGIADDVTRELIRAAGGLEAMQSALESYTDNFFSDAEKNAMKTGQLSDEFEKLGLTMPTTKQGFRDLVDSLSATGPEGQQLAMQVLLLSDAFADLYDSSQAVVDAARNDLSDAYERESQALIDTKERFEEFAKSLGDFKDSLIMGDLSPMNALEKYNVAKARFDDVAARAAAGDEGAMAEFESIAAEFLQLSRDVYASGDQYTADFNRVISETDALQANASGQASIAEQQLDALNAQVEGLLDINESVMTVTEAIIALQEAMASGFIDDVDGSHANGLAYVPHDGYVAELHKGERVLTAEENRSYPMDYSQYGSGNTTALVQEIKALRQEVANLREGQREQTGAIVAANYDAAARNADAVVEGQKDAVRSSNYMEKVKVNLA